MSIYYGNRKISGSGELSQSNFRITGTGTSGQKVATFLVNGIRTDIYAPMIGGESVVGSIIAYTGTKTPAGYLQCDGSLVNKEDYPDLYEIIGDSYGTGTETQFKLPDLTNSSCLLGDTNAGTKDSRPIINSAIVPSQSEEQNDQINTVSVIYIIRAVADNVEKDINTAVKEYVAASTKKWTFTIQNDDGSTTQQTLNVYAKIDEDE